MRTFQLIFLHDVSFSFFFDKKILHIFSSLKINRKKLGKKFDEKFLSSFFLRNKNHFILVGVLLLKLKKYEFQ
jgi:hypothetical protein